MGKKIIDEFTNLPNNHSRWVARHRKHCNEYKNNFQRVGYKKNKEEIFQLLGNKCSNINCPIPKDKMDNRCLQIDHVNNNGAKERKIYSPSQLIIKILKEIKKGSKDYQLLCPYCNWLKRYVIIKKGVN